MKPDLEFISRILTLRYDPLRKPVRRRMEPADFMPKDIANPAEEIDRIAKRELERLHREHRFRKASLSLSGGIDSRLTLSWLRSFVPDVKVKCISIGFGEPDDEVCVAREVARLHNCDFQELILTDVLSELPKLIGIVKEPRWNLYQYYAFKLGKKESSFFFTGDGGDEAFGGYTFRYQKFLKLLTKGAAWKAKTKLYLNCHERDWVQDQAVLFGSAIDFHWEDIYQILKPSFDNNLPPLDQLFLADLNGKLLFDWLPTNHAFEGRLEMTIRSVFLSGQMSKFATHLPWQMKYNPASGEGKLPLTQLLSKYEKKPAHMRKKGFSVNLVSMWDAYARDKVRCFVHNDSEVVRNKIINPRWIQKTYRLLEEGSSEQNPRYINKMILILALEIWYRLFFSKTLKPNCKI